MGWGRLGRMACQGILIRRNHFRSLFCHIRFRRVMGGNGFVVGWKEVGVLVLVGWFVEELILGLI